MRLQSLLSTLPTPTSSLDGDRPAGYGRLGLDEGEVLAWHRDAVFLG
jgi:hypothetical protein